MPRPHRCRRVAGPPGFASFKPAGVPAASLEEVVLRVDELEALRLADVEGLYQEAAAEHMNVSRATFGRIVGEARRKVATALVRGMALRIEGGAVQMADTRLFECLDCGHTWPEPFGTGRPNACPECGSDALRRADDGAGRGPGQGAGRGRGGRGMGRGRGRG